VRSVERDRGYRFHWHVSAEGRGESRGGGRMEASAVEDHRGSSLPVMSIQYSLNKGKSILSRGRIDRRSRPIDLP